jgi:hypothetical protein
MTVGKNKQNNRSCVEIHEKNKSCFTQEIARGVGTRGQYNEIS